MFPDNICGFRGFFEVKGLVKELRISSDLQFPVLFVGEFAGSFVAFLGFEGDECSNWSGDLLIFSFLYLVYLLIHLFDFF